jgi:hypothetical protein
MIGPRSAWRRNEKATVQKARESKYFGPLRYLLSPSSSKEYKINKKDANGLFSDVGNAILKASQLATTVRRPLSDSDGV